MKILITYLSQTGNTEKVARAMSDALKKGHEVVIKKIEEFPNDGLSGYDLVFIGSPCHAGDLAGPVKELLSAIPAGLKAGVAGFLTHAATVYNKQDFEKCRMSFESILSEKKLSLADFFDCQGLLNPAIHDYVKKMKEIGDEEWSSRVEQMTGHPDEEDLKNAAAFARRLAGG